MNPIARYSRWLHTMWPAGTVEKLPDVREDGTTAVPGVRVVGDLTGVPLLKFSSDTGARAVELAIEALGDRVDRYVFVSTVSVYADHSVAQAQVEDAPLDPHLVRHLLQIPMSRGCQPDMRMEGACAAQAFELLLLEYPQ